MAGDDEKLFFTKQDIIDSFDQLILMARVVESGEYYIYHLGI